MPLFCEQDSVIDLAQRKIDSAFSRANNQAHTKFRRTGRLRSEGRGPADALRGGGEVDLPRRGAGACSESPVFTIRYFDLSNGFL